jgi:SAM-dependent methyltransferase
VASAAEEAVRSLGIPDGARVLDAGTGAGGGLVALARAAAEVRVVGVDLSPAVIDLAAEHAASTGVDGQVTLRTADLHVVLDESAGEFDAIWASDVVWPGNFDDPADTVRRMATALTPGGVLALFYSNYYQSMFLPGHSRLERMLRTASELRWGLPGDGPMHYERHVGWLVAAGLREVQVRVFPASAARSTRTDRAALSRTGGVAGAAPVRRVTRPSRWNVRCGHRGRDGAADAGKFEICPGRSRLLPRAPDHPRHGPRVTTAAVQLSMACGRCVEIWRSRAGSSLAVSGVDSSQ